MKKMVIPISEEKEKICQQLFKELEEFGPTFFSFLSLRNDNKYLYTCNYPEWKKIYFEESIIEKDMINYLVEGSSLRKWVCWNNIPQNSDPHDLKKKRMEICQTVKSSSILLESETEKLYLNFAFNWDTDIESFLWDNHKLLRYQLMGLKNLFKD